MRRNDLFGEIMIDENKFWELVNKWEFDTRFNSTVRDSLAHPAITEIILMGYDVIPLVLTAMKGNYHLAFVLHKITGEWPVKDEFAGKSDKIIECWQKWAKKRGYRNETKTAAR